MNDYFCNERTQRFGQLAAAYAWTSAAYAAARVGVYNQFPTGTSRDGLLTLHQIALVREHHAAEEHLRSLRPQARESRTLEVVA